MNRIDKVTIGIDWEMIVNDAETGYSPDKERFTHLIEQSHRKTPDLEIGEDFDLLEVRLGMTISIDEFIEKIHRAFETCQKVARSLGLVLIPLGIREIDKNPAGGHIHFGSVQNFRDSVELYNRLMPFAPAITAFASSSPDLAGQYKSYRIRLNAGYCANPMSGINVEDSIPHWGTDVCIKYPWKATIEFRAADSQPLPELMVEFAALYCGLASALSRRKKSPYPPDVHDYCLNRINAMRYGAQATFRLKKKEISVSEIMLENIIPLAIEGLDKFGRPPGDFKKIRTMAKKRISVADWVRAVIPQGTDLWRATGEITRIFAADVDILEWLQSRHIRRIKPFESPEDILLESIGIGTPLFHIYDAVPLPRTRTEQLLDEAVESGKARRYTGDKNEILFDIIIP